MAWGYDGPQWMHVAGAPIGTGYQAISAGGGGGTSMVILADDSIFVWVSVTGNEARSGNFSALAAGGVHQLGLAADGSISAWGSDASNQVSDTPTGIGFQHITAGWRHSLAIAADGSISAWGADEKGQVSDVPGGTNWQDIAAGHEFSLALATDGSLFGWGAAVSTATPGVDWPLGNNFIDVDAGAYHALALQAVPLPAAAWLFGSALGLLAWLGKRVKPRSERQSP